MRVLQLTSDWKWTGPAEPMLRLGLAQRERGFEVYLACPMAPGPDERGVSQEAEKGGLPPEIAIGRGRGLRPLADRVDVGTLRALIDHHEIDVVHTWHTRDHLLALRAAGQNNKVLIYQFLKPPSLDIGERFALQLGAVRIRVEALDVPWDMATSFDDPEAVAGMKTAIRGVLAQLAETAEKNFYDVLILDEIVFCLSKGLTRLEDVKNLVAQRYPTVEIVLTGRGATAELTDMADLVTEMKNVKHPLDAGQPARRGIEY